MILTLAAHHPAAHENIDAAHLAAREWARAQRTSTGDDYGDRMLTRLVEWFERGVLGHQRKNVNSNYDAPLERAYREGRELRQALTKLYGPSDAGTGAANPDAIIVPRP